jgi:hypothetical protein
MMVKTLDDKLSDLVAGDFVYCRHLGANVEILKVIDRGNAYDNYSLDRYCFSVAGRTAPKDSRFWGLPDKSKETIFHKEMAKDCYSIEYRAVLSEDEFQWLLE